MSNATGALLGLVPLVVTLRLIKEILPKKHNKGNPHMNHMSHRTTRTTMKAMDVRMNSLRLRR